MFPPRRYRLALEDGEEEVGTTKYGRTYDDDLDNPNVYALCGHAQKECADGDFEDATREDVE
jgi:hypothetical protein